MRHFIYLCVILLFFSSCVAEHPSFNEEQISLVPKPKSFQLNKASFLFTPTTKIVIENESQKMAVNYLNHLFKTAAGFEFEILDSEEKASVVFKENKNIQPEAYQLKVTESKIIIEAIDPAGYFYAVQTLRQLLPVDIEKKSITKKDWLVPCVDIQDEPRFSWRGMQMDFSRHFFSIDEVKTFLDYMALYKLNTYHMHLTDDQGWRVEIKKISITNRKRRLEDRKLS